LCCLQAAVVVQIVAIVLVVVLRYTGVRKHIKQRKTAGDVVAMD